MEEERNYAVYMHICPNEKKYVGITCQNIKNRWGNNGIGYKTQPFYNAIIHYGWENIEHKILLQNLTQEDAQFKEMEYIQKYNSLFPNGWNFTEGGESEIPSENTKNKLSKKTKEAWNRRSENEIQNIKNKISEKAKGKNNSQSKMVICENYVFMTINDFKKCFNLSHGKRSFYSKKARFFNEKIDNINNYIVYKDNIILDSEIVIYNNKEYKNTMELSNDININYNTLKHYLNGYISTPLEIYQLGLKYKHKKSKVYSRDEVIGVKISIVCDDMIFESISKLKKKNNNKKCSHLNEYLNGNRPMPQKWKDRGLRYYNEETDKDLPIWNEKGDVNE